jgi:hypothetical protein
MSINSIIIWDVMAYPLFTNTNFSTKERNVNKIWKWQSSLPVGLLGNGDGLFCRSNSARPGKSMWLSGTTWVMLQMLAQALQDQEPETLLLYLTPMWPFCFHYCIRYLVFMRTAWSINVNISSTIHWIQSLALWKILRLLSSGTWCWVYCWTFIDVSEEVTALTFRVEEWR